MAVFGPNTRTAAFQGFDLDDRQISMVAEVSKLPCLSILAINDNNNNNSNNNNNNHNNIELSAAQRALQ